MRRFMAVNLIRLAYRIYPEGEKRMGRLLGYEQAHIIADEDARLRFLVNAASDAAKLSDQLSLLTALAVNHRLDQTEDD